MPQETSAICFWSIPATVSGYECPWAEIEFHRTGREMRKLLDPKQRVLVRGIVRSPCTADHRWPAGMSGYDRKGNFAQTVILKLIRWRRENQCSRFLSTEMMWSTFFLFKISLPLGFEHRLLSFCEVVCGPIVNTVAIVDATWYEGNGPVFSLLLL